MEVQCAFEAGDGDKTPTPSTIGWLSPRVSFSRDFVMQHRLSPEKRGREASEEHVFSPEFEFCSSAGLDLTSMLAADELFVDGKVRVDRTWREEVRLIEREEEQRDDKQLKSFYENPRCSSMFVEGSWGMPSRSCISLENSTFPSPFRSFPRSPSTPSSPKPSSSKNTKVKEFLKLHLSRIRHLPSFELHKDIPAPSGRRMPISSISFWPFSRSNSAGESKRTPAVSPPPRRSKSAGENKTSISSLLHSLGNVTVEAKTNKSRLPQSDQEKTGLPPLSTSTAKRSSGNHSFLMPLHCSTKSVALSSQSASESTTSSICSSSVSFHGSSLDKRVHKSGSAHRYADSVAFSNSSGGDPQGTLVSSLPTGRSRSCSSAGLPTRRGTSIATRNLSRSSPGRNGVRIGTGRGGAARKGVGRPRDVLHREACIVSGPSYNPSLSVMPVLNMPVRMGPSSRGAKTSSKTNMFTLGGLFSKREGPAKGDSLLPPDRQSGA